MGDTGSAALSRRRLLGMGSGVVAALAAIPLARRAQQGRDGQGQEPYQQGLQAFREGDYERAAEAFGEAARRDPQQVGAVVFRGMALARLDRPGNAIEEFSKALTLAPDWATIYLYRGEALAAMGERARAEDDFAQAERLANGDSRIEAAARGQRERLGGS